MGALGKVTAGTWICSWFSWKSHLPGKSAFVKTAKRLPRISWAARFEVKKKCFSRSTSRTIVRFFLAFLFCMGPAALLGTPGRFHPASFLVLMSGVFFTRYFLYQAWALGINLQFAVRNVSVGKWEIDGGCSEAMWLNSFAMQLLGIAGARPSLLQFCIPLIPPKCGSHSWQPSYFKSMTLLPFVMKCCYSGYFMRWCNYMKLYKLDRRSSICKF